MAQMNPDARILMIDMDPQASLTRYCGYNLDDSYFEGKSIISLFDKKVDATSCCFSVDRLKTLSNLYLTPSGQMAAVWERDLAEHKDTILVFKQKIEELKEWFQYILLDCPPNLSFNLLSALYVSDEVVIPVSTNYVSADSLPLLFSTIRQMQESSDKRLSNPGLKVAGIIATMFRVNSAENKEVLADLQSKHTILGIVKQSAIVTKGFKRGLPVVMYSTKSEPSRAYVAIAAELMT